MKNTKHTPTQAAIKAAIFSENIVASYARSEARTMDVARSIDEATGLREILEHFGALLNELDGYAFYDTGTAKAEMLFDKAAAARAVLAKHTVQ